MCTRIFQGQVSGGSDVGTQLAADRVPLHVTSNVHVRLCVRVAGRGAVVLSPPTHSSVGALREAVVTMLRYDPAELRLWFEGRELEDATSLWALGLRDWATVDGTGSLVGGMHTGAEVEAGRQSEDEHTVSECLTPRL